MGRPCSACGGTGWGYLDPEIGHRGTDPCPECEGALQDRLDKGLLDVEVRKPGGKLELVRPEVSLGRPVSLPKEKRKTVDFVDSVARAGAEEEEGMTVDELVEKGVFSQDEVDAQNVKDLEAMGLGGGEAGEE